MVCILFIHSAQAYSVTRVHFESLEIVSYISFLEFGAYDFLIGAFDTSFVRPSGFLLKLCTSLKCTIRRIMMPQNQCTKYVSIMNHAMLINLLNEWKI